MSIENFKSKSQFQTFSALIHKTRRNNIWNNRTTKSTAFIILISWTISTFQDHPLRTFRVKTTKCHPLFPSLLPIFINSRSFEIEMKHIAAAPSSYTRNIRWSFSITFCLPSTPSALLLAPCCQPGYRNMLIKLIYLFELLNSKERACKIYISPSFS